MLVHITLGAVAGFLLCAFLGYGAIQLLPGNTHDRSVEAVMTTFFVAGPIGAVIGAGIGLFLSKRSQ